MFQCLAAGERKADLGSALALYVLLAGLDELFPGQDAAMVGAGVIQVGLGQLSHGLRTILLHRVIE